MNADEIIIYRDVTIAGHRCGSADSAKIELEVACLREAGKSGGFGTVKSARLNTSFHIGDHKSAIVKFPIGREEDATSLRFGS